MDEEVVANENTEYEILTKEIYNCLLKADGIENVDIKHDLKLPGKSGCIHQIDVYWEFRLAGEVHKIAIECKNYSKEVSIAKVRDFFGVIYDIGNIKGIFVSKNGFQSGAKKFADYYGISLKEIRYPKDEDWKGRLKRLEFEINLMPTKLTGVYVEPDVDWIINNGLINSEKEKSNIVFPTRILNIEMLVFDEMGNTITNFLELESRLPHDFKVGKGLKYKFDYENAYLDSNLGRVKVKWIGFVYDILNESSSIILDANEIVNAIIKDVKSGEIRFVNKDGTVK